MHLHSPVAGGFLSGKKTFNDITDTRATKAPMYSVAHYRQYNKPELHGAIRHLN